MKKILFITGSLNQGGAEYQILALAKLFQNNGHQVEVFAITDYSFYRQFVNKNNIKYTHLLNEHGKIKRTIQVVNYVRKTKPNLIISYLKVPSQIAIFSNFFSMGKTKLIVGERTSLILPKHDFYYFNLMRFSNALTVNSISKIDYIKQRFPFLRKKIHFFPNILDIENYKQKTVAQKNILKVGFVGRLSPEKNIINLIKAIALLDKESIKVTLDIYGDARNNEYFNKIKKSIAINNLSKIVTLKGKTDNVKKVYQELDLLCLISDYEGFSNVISESLCSGLPVVTSKIPENEFLIKDCVNGFVVNHKEPKSIANGIKKYSELNLYVKQQMSNSCRTKAEELFDKEQVYKKYIDLITSL